MEVLLILCGSVCFFFVLNFTETVENVEPISFCHYFFMHFLWGYFSVLLLFDIALSSEIHTVLREGVHNASIILQGGSWYVPKSSGGVLLKKI